MATGNAHSFVVEFVGLPGSGKTTISKALERLSGPTMGGLSLHPIRAGIPRQFGQKILSAAIDVPTYVLEDAAGAKQLLGLIAEASSPISTRLLFSYRLCRLLVKLSARRRPLEGFILDEGLLQLVAAICVPFTGGLPRRLDTLVRATLPGRVDAIVVVECNVETSIARIETRPPKRGRFDTWPRDTLRGMLHAMNFALEAGIEAARNAGTPILTISADSAPESSATEVAEWITQLRVLPAVTTELPALQTMV